MDDAMPDDRDELPDDRDELPDDRDDTNHRRWLELLPAIVVVGVGVPVVALRPAIVQGTVGSPRALVITAVITAVILVWSAVLRRLGVRPAARAGLVLLPIALVGFAFVRPYFTDTRVDEALPGAADVEPAVAVGPTSTPTPATPAEPTAEPPAKPTAGATRGGAASEASRPEAGRRAAAPSAQPSAEPSPTRARPVAVSRGRFVGLDGHRAAGTAAVFRLPDDDLVVRLEDVDLQSVPEAYVYLVPRRDATAPGRGAIELGPLKGNVGSSNYRLPRSAAVDPDRRWTVLVWCRPFASPVGAADQRPIG